MIALSSLFALAGFFLWMAPLLPAYSIAFAILYRDQGLRDNPPAFAPSSAPYRAAV